jgi:hypothetical protein
MGMHFHGAWCMVNDAFAFCVFMCRNREREPRINPRMTMAGKWENKFFCVN